MDAEIGHFEIPAGIHKSAVEEREPRTSLRVEVVVLGEQSAAWRSGDRLVRSIRTIPNQGFRPEPPARAASGRTEAIPVAGIVVSAARRGVVSTARCGISATRAGIVSAVRSIVHSAASIAHSAAGAIVAFATLLERAGVAILDSAILSGTALHRAVALFLIRPALNRADALHWTFDRRRALRHRLHIARRRQRIGACADPLPRLQLGRRWWWIFIEVDRRRANSAIDVLPTKIILARGQPDSFSVCSGSEERGGGEAIGPPPCKLPCHGRLLSRIGTTAQCESHHADRNFRLASSKLVCKGRVVPQVPKMRPPCNAHAPHAAIHQTLRYDTRAWSTRHDRSTRLVPTCPPYGSCRLTEFAGSTFGTSGAAGMARIARTSRTPPRPRLLRPPQKPSILPNQNALPQIAGGG